MIRKSKAPEIREANLTFQQMKAAIPRIERRIADLDQFDVASVSDRSDPRISALSSSLEALLASIFGTGTVEYDRYSWHVTNLDTAAMSILYPAPIEEVREGLLNGIATARAHLEENQENVS